MRRRSVCQSNVLLTTTTGRLRSRLPSRGTRAPSSSIARSRCRWSVALAISDSSRVERPRSASPRLAVTVASSCETPWATSVSPLNTRLPSIRTVSPLFSRVHTPWPTWSIRGMPASARIRGPRLGYRPVLDCAALMTARTRRSTSASAWLRSRSVRSTTAMSPARSEAWLVATAGESGHAGESGGGVGGRGATVPGRHRGPSCHALRRNPGRREACQACPFRGRARLRRCVRVLPCSRRSSFSPSCWRSSLAGLIVRQVQLVRSRREVRAPA